MSARKLPKKDFLWTPDLAYAVGLITTDGSLSKDKRHISLTSSDKELLRHFKNCLGLRNRITSNPKGSFRRSRQSWRVQFGNVQLYNWLVKVGLKHNKTYTLGPLRISDEAFVDFLRGWLDGDGTIIAYEDRYNLYKNKRYSHTRLLLKFGGVSEKHILWLQERINGLLGTTGAVVKTKPRRPNRHPYYELKYAKKDSVKIINWVYYASDVPCLARKRKIAEPFLR